MHIYTLCHRWLTGMLLIGVMVLAMLGCAQTQPQWAAPAGHVEKLPVLKVTPVVMDNNPASAGPGAPQPLGQWFDVAFDYHGQNYLARLPFDPGAWVLVVTRTAPAAPQVSVTAPTSPSDSPSVSLPNSPLPEPTSSPPTLPSSSGLVVGSVSASPSPTPLPATLYVLPPSTDVGVYPLVYNTFYMAGPAFFYAGGYYYYRHRYLGGTHWTGGRGAPGGRGGHGRR